MIILAPLALASLMLAGAIFGFFYAWVCSTMWGLDAADPRIAITAMQAMNESVRNAVFAPAFFGTPFALFATAVAARVSGARPASAAFGAAGMVYLLGGLVLTMAVNVPMNDALAAVTVPATLDEARAVWEAYSPRWQAFNQLRTVASGLALGLTGFGLCLLRTA